MRRRPERCSVACSDSHAWRCSRMSHGRGVTAPSLCFLGAAHFPCRSCSSLASSSSSGGGCSSWVACLTSNSSASASTWVPLQLCSALPPLRTARVSPRLPPPAPRSLIKPPPASLFFLPSLQHFNEFLRLPSPQCCG